MRSKLIVLLLIATLGAAAQTKKADVEPPKIRIEALSEKSGTFSRKEFIEIGKAGKVTVDVISITDLTTNVTTNGLRLSAYSASTYSSGRKTAYFDADEVDGLLKVMNYVNEKVFTAPVPTNSTEFNFYARAGASAGAFSRDKNWSGYVDLEKYGSDGIFFINQDDYKKLTDLIVQAKSKL